MVTDVKDDNWLAIPQHVRSLYIKHAGACRALADAYPDDAYWVIRDDMVGDIYIKNAGFLEGPANASTALQRVVGGPNPVTSSLLAGALGAGLGYGGGTLIENLFPEKYMQRGRLRRNLALMGGLAGAAVPAMAWGVPAVTGKHGWRGAFNGWPYRPEDQQDSNELVPRSWAKQDWAPHADTGVPQMPQGDKPGVAAPQATIRANQGPQGFQPGLPDKSAAFESPPSSLTGAGGAFLPKIQRDAFNRSVLNDPFMDQRLKGQAMGLSTAASMARGRSSFSPIDVARVGGSMLGGGLMGAAMGLMAGKVMSAFAGITPEAQKAVQKAGIMAGLLSAVVPRVYGR
jgi:hypothetical protein